MDAENPDGSESQDSLTDLVPVTTARNGAEATMLVALLEDEDIPAIITGMNASNTFAGMTTFDPRICVPRSMKEKAIEALDRIRKDAEAKGMEDAFQPEHQEELLEDSLVDPELNAAKALQDMPLDERLVVLRHKLPKWLADNESNVRIAERLAAAGLTREQADEFMTKIKSEDEIVKEARDKRTLSGLGLLGLGVALIIWRPGAYGYGIALVVAGLGIMFSANHIQPTWKTKDS